MHFGELFAQECKKDEKLTEILNARYKDSRALRQATKITDYRWTDNSNFTILFIIMLII